MRDCRESQHDAQQWCGWQATGSSPSRYHAVLPGVFENDPEPQLVQLCSEGAPVVAMYVPARQGIGHAVAEVQKWPTKQDPAQVGLV